MCFCKDPEMAPIKRHAYNAEFKLKAISHALEHGNRAAAREFNINGFSSAQLIGGMNE